MKEKSEGSLFQAAYSSGMRLAITSIGTRASQARESDQHCMIKAAGRHCSLVGPEQVAEETCIYIIISGVCNCTA